MWLVVPQLLGEQHLGQVAVEAGGFQAGQEVLGVGVGQERERVPQGQPVEVGENVGGGLRGGVHFAAPVGDEDAAAADAELPQELLAQLGPGVAHGAKRRPGAAERPAHAGELLPVSEQRAAWQDEAGVAADLVEGGAAHAWGDPRDGLVVVEPYQRDLLVAYCRLHRCAGARQ